MDKTYIKMRISNGKDLNFYIDFMDRYKIKKLDTKYKTSVKVM